MKNSTASRRVVWLQMSRSQSKETLLCLPPRADPFTDVEGDEDELEEFQKTSNPLHYAFYCTFHRIMRLVYVHMCYSNISHN